MILFDNCRFLNATPDFRNGVRSNRNIRCDRRDDRSPSLPGPESANCGRWKQLTAERIVRRGVEAANCSFHGAGAAAER